MKRVRTVIASLIALCSLGAVENSITPVVAFFEKPENLSGKKYPSDQYAEILASLARKEERVRLATYNILFNINDDKFSAENRWPQRLSRVMDVLREMDPDILGVQELYPTQYRDLAPCLKDTHACYAPEEIVFGEINAIFYRKERFELLGSRVWFLPGSSQIHIGETLTMVHLKDVKTGKQFAVFNTHLPFLASDERGLHARLIAGYIAPFVEKMAVLLMGDLNTFPNRPDLTKLPFYDGDRVSRILEEGGLRDARELSILGHVGPFSTFTNAAEDVIPFTGTGTPGVFLDHIFTSKGIQVLIHAVQPGTVEGHFPSDHLPLFIDFFAN